MALKKDRGPTCLMPLRDDHVALLKKGIADAEMFEERAKQATADKRAVVDRLAGWMEPLGFEKSDVVALMGRRRKDRERVTTQDVRVHRLEVALGMATSDLFDAAAASLTGATTAAQAVDASVQAGNAAAKLESAAKAEKKARGAKKVDAVPAVVDEAASSNQPLAAETDRLKDEGRASWARGAGDEACKYPPNSRERILWIQGWDESNDEWQKDQADNAAPKTPAGNVVSMPKGQDYLRAVGADI